MVSLNCAMLFLSTFFTLNLTVEYLKHNNVCLLCAADGGVTEWVPLVGVDSTNV